MNIDHYRRLRNVNRMGTEPILRPYNLLEHSYMVTVLFMHFAEKESITYSTDIIDLILHHDIIETQTGDLPWNIKNMNSSTQVSWNILETQVIAANEDFNKYSDEKIRNALRPEQFNLFKVCDMLELWIFLKEEQVLGNNSKECKRIIDTAEKVIYGMWPSIDKYMRTIVF